MNPREELVSLMRGFFATPLLTILGKRGILDKFLKGTVNLNELGSENSKIKIKKVFSYLSSIGLIELVNASEEIYGITLLGEKIFKRFGSLVLLYSYRDMISNVDPLIFSDDFPFPKCDRLDNVIGSGLTNGRKFFPAGINAIEHLNVSVIADLCCGNGEFIRQVHQRFPEAIAFAGDLSEIAIEETIRNLSDLAPRLKVYQNQADVLDCDKWISKLRSVCDQNNSGDVVISMWYLLHEISNYDVNNVVLLLNEIYEKFPKANLLIGEIVKIPEQVLSEYRHSSIMPEFILFHDFSGQGILTWEQYQEVIHKIPYKLTYEKKLDIISTNNGEIPSAIVWLLEPN